jgi:nitrogenase-associated protein
MKIVIFYEKPGCATNAKQKKSLREAGCMVIERDLLRHGLNAEELYGFLRGMPVGQWFNPNAPKIKSGEIDPFRISKEVALRMLMMEPILIRRPLMVIAGRKLCGFDSANVETLLDRKFERHVSTACSNHEERCATVLPVKKEL